MEERRLYCAVILQAIEDAVNTRVSTDGKHNGSVPLQDQQAARKWLTLPSRDLQDVCSVADVPMSTVLTFGRMLDGKQWDGTKISTTTRRRMSLFMSGTKGQSLQVS